MKYIIGTRGSRLAVAQAESVRATLAQAYPEDVFELRIIKTTGDINLDKPLHEIGGKGVFVTEIEAKLLSYEIDIGVHSMKDMPVVLPDGLTLAKAWKRADPRDVLILRNAQRLEDLPQGASIGTGSRRREFQLKDLRPDLRIISIRGNIDTRIRKMEEEKLDGIVLAAAAIQRLHLKGLNICYMELAKMPCAPAQGILAMEIRESDKKLAAMLNSFYDEDAFFAAEAERGFLNEIDGGCNVPAAAFCCKLSDESEALQKIYQMHAMLASHSATKLANTLVCGTRPDILAQKAAIDIRRQIAGTVSLVGAGPGDIGLITVRGLNAVKEADCIIYDRLVPIRLLEEAKANCQFIYVGKKAHNHTLNQAEINRLLLQKSMQYSKIVRLKGGDPFVFGRGGEEALYLKEHGVPCEVIPGISSCIAAPAMAGIPVTHRGMANGFHVVTASDRYGKLADLNFQAMADSKETCIFLMSLSKVAEIADKLMDAGMPADTKAAVISQAATIQQRVCVSKLSNIADSVKCAGLVSPAMIVVGDVVSLHGKLADICKRPLSHKRYLIPKITEGPTRLGTLLLEQGALVQEIQVGTIIYQEKQFTADWLKQIDWLIFTSKHGVFAFFDNLARNKLDIRNLFGCKIAAIGAKTEQSLNEYGLYADLIPANFHSGALADALKKTVSNSDNVLYVKADGVENCALKSLGHVCHYNEMPIYENKTVSQIMDDTNRHNCGFGNKAQLAESFGHYDGILFTCASSVERTIGAYAPQTANLPDLYSIGPKTTECLKNYGYGRIYESHIPTYEGIVQLCIEKATRMEME